MPAAKLTRADREHVQATYSATGCDAVETAKRHNLTPDHVRVMAKRYAWTRASDLVTLAQNAQDQAHALANSRAGAVTRVTAAQAITEVLADYGTRTKAGFAKAAAKYAEHVAEVPAAELVEHSRAAKDWSGTAATIHGWQRDSGSPIVTLNLAFFGGTVS